VDGCVYFVAKCPAGEQRYLHSNNADLFRYFRSKYNGTLSEKGITKGCSHINLIEITNACNYKCKFCYSGANKDDAKYYLSVEDAVSIGRNIKKHGGYSVTLTGGEPTLHKDLIRMVKELKKLGLFVQLATNGSMLARDASLAVSLRKAGLSGIQLQLDSIRRSIHVMHRDNGMFEEKFEALKNSVNAGLNISIAATITKHNLDDTGDLIDHCLRYIPHFYLISLIIYFPDGHSKIEKDSIVFKEEVVSSLGKHEKLKDLFKIEYFYPMPSFQPLKLSVHPDCGLYAMLLSEKGELTPLNEIVNIDKLYRLLSFFNLKIFPPIMGYFLLVILVAVAAKRGTRARLLRALWGFMTKRGTSSFIAVAIEQFMPYPVQDIQRAYGCGMAIWNKEGKNQVGCFSNRKDKYAEGAASNAPNI
jgi:MoaA/NifB/PqqE/SkfB family radical SAM enzyme